MANNGELPSEYDVIILGTGMTECIVAAALSRIGQSVLHLDRNDYYSGDWASFHFEGLKDWIKKQQMTKPPSSEHDVTSDMLQEGETSVSLTVHSQTISNVKERIFVRMEPIEPAISKTEEDVSIQIADQNINEPVEESPETIEKDSQIADDVADTHKGTVKTEAQPEQRGREMCNVHETTHQTASDVSEKKCRVEPEKQWSFSEISRQWRKFNIDLMPKLLYCRGSMVDLLIESDIAKYCEFQCVSRVAAYINGVLEQVPCSRADVFSSKKMTMVDKRVMMKFLVFCLHYQQHPSEYTGFEEKPFVEFLHSQKLSETVRHYIQHAIAMVTDKATTIEGLKHTQHFLQSLGRYGNTAFLWPLYGSGELPQCFCRMCAVFGGIYCLSRTGRCLIVDSNDRCKAIVDTEGQRLTCKHIVMDASYANPTMLRTPPADRKLLSRAILLTDRSFLTDSRDHITLLHLPVNSEIPHPVTILELAPSAMASPDGIYVVHLTCRATLTAEDDLSHVSNLLFNSHHHNDNLSDDTADRTGDGAGDRTADDSPRILWAVYFNVAVTEDDNMAYNVGDNIFVVGAPNEQFDFDQCIKQARRIFHKICEGEEFLPKAPNPEDIIYDEEETTNTEPAIEEPEQPEVQQKVVDDVTGGTS